MNTDQKRPKSKAFHAECAEARGGRKGEIGIATEISKAIDAAWSVLAGPRYSDASKRGRGDLTDARASGGRRKAGDLRLEVRDFNASCAIRGEVG